MNRRPQGTTMQRWLSTKFLSQYYVIEDSSTHSMGQTYEHIWAHSEYGGVWLTTSFPCFFLTIPTVYLSMHTCFNSYIYIQHSIKCICQHFVWCNHVSKTLITLLTADDNGAYWQHIHMHLAVLSKQRDATTVFIYSTTLTLSHSNFLTALNAYDFSCSSIM